MSQNVLKPVILGHLKQIITEKKLVFNIFSFYLPFLFTESYKQHKTQN